MSRGRKRKYDKSVYRSLALITQFGINMLVPIGMLTAFGIWLDGKLGTSYWTVLLFFVGAVAGGQNVYRMAKAVYAPDGKQEQNNQSNQAGQKDTRIKERDIAHENTKPTHTDIET
ncbi:MAG: AtpZ/AtpI family protein [Lachnospiraceae bacterium]|nr:AtpZ/AtpI family protein [Lachnospiraceae bacterium]